MKRFSFRLDRVLEVRRRQEERAQQVFSEACRERNQSRERLDDCEQALDDHITQFQNQAQNGFSALEALLHSSFSDKLRTEARDEQDVLLECENQVETKREDLIASMKRKKILETLRERRQGEHLKSIRREEQKEIDDQAGRQNHHQEHEKAVNA